MAYSCRAESGLQLMARLSSRPPLNGLEDVVFSGGPGHHDTVEISGDPASGKTLLLTQLLAKCLLPKREESWIVGGLGVGAVIVDTDHHFQVFRLVNLMESWLRKCELVDSKKNRLSSKTIEAIIKASLKNLIVLNCYDSMQMLVNFHSLGKILTANPNVSLVVLDSATAYYWQDVMAGGVKKMDLYLKNILGAMHKCIQEFKVVVMYTKQSYFQSKFSEGAAELGKNVSYRISLQNMDAKDTSSNMFYANIAGPTGNKMQKYVIDGDGLRWIC
ncbi:DNA repair protein XRCC2 [Bacillus rossius redtenbacheri]|uniref:DNA repair protein XRCC2 n=1 Tax=Bacillus rossius redtenbacheri TaxID=93214 RepID=UPI002FDD6751